MKKICLAAIATCLALSVTAAPLAASAEGKNQADYPEVFTTPVTFDALTDFAVANENLMAFADGETVVLWRNEVRIAFDLGQEVKAVGYAEGKFYYTLSSSNSPAYVLPEDEGGDLGQAAESLPEGIFDKVTSRDVTNPDNPKQILYHYYYEGDEVFSVLNQQNSKVTSFAGVSGVKVYNDTLYAIYENGLCTISGETQSAIELVYSNYDLLTKIAVGDSYEQLKTLNSAPMLVTIASGSSITSFEINNLTGTSEVFPIVNPRQSTVTTEQQLTGLLIWETGNASVIAIGTQCYILNGGNVSAKVGMTLTPTEGVEATVNAADWAHSTPYMSNPTRIFEIAPAEKVTVLNKISADSYPQLAHDFYLIKNAQGQQGYVAAEFLEIDSPVFDEDPPTTIVDPDPHTDDYIRIVVLVLVIVVLVLCAAGYVTWVATSNNRKKPSKDGEVDLGSKDDEE